MTELLFPTTIFGELVEVNPSVSLDRNVPHPFVAMEDVRSGDRYVTNHRHRKLTGGAKFSPGDTLFARITPCLENGKIAQFDPRARASGFGSTEFIVLRAKAAKADPAFVFYLARTRWVRGPAIKSMLGASGRQRARHEAITSALVPDIPLALQRRIASVLEAYDDLIEVNRRRIALLEEMARRLFDEWFIHFRFPGHEGHVLVETPEGPLPQGWHTRKIGDICVYLSRGIAPKYDETASTLVVGQKCIRDQHLSLAPARRQSRSVAPDKLVRPGDVLINSTGVGTLGRVAQAEDIPDGLTVDTHVTIVRPRTELDRDFFGLALLRMEPMFERMGAGSTGQTELNRGRIADVTLSVPPESVQSDFGQRARPLRALSYQLARQNSVLAASRDLLLPRLISGEFLSVATAERELEAVA